MDNVDTIIIDTQDDFIECDKDTLEGILKYLSIFEKNIILACQDIENKYLKKMLRDYSPAVFYNSIPELSFLNIENSYDELPLLTILNYSSANLIDILSVLHKFLCEDSYNPVIFTDNSYGLYCGYNYFSLEHINRYESIKSSYQRINDVINFYNGDIGIMGINCCEGNDSSATC